MKGDMPEDLMVALAFRTYTVTDIVREERERLRIECKSNIN